MNAFLGCWGDVAVVGAIKGTGMSELIFAGFADNHRAAQVVNELERLEHGWATAFDHAAVIARDEEGRSQIVLRMGLSDRRDVIWGRLWAALLRDALGMPFMEELVPPSLSPQWWWDEFEIDAEFVRDVGAFFLPGTSAILVLLEVDSTQEARRRLRNLGATLVCLTLRPEQEQKIQEILLTLPPRQP